MKDASDSSNNTHYAQVLLDVPIAESFDYVVPQTMDVATVVTGCWVVVPWGKSRRVGIVTALTDSPSVDPDRIKPVECVLDDAPILPPSWFELGRFATSYYHRHAGEILLPAIPKLLRASPSNKPTARKKTTPFYRARQKFKPENTEDSAPLPELTGEQRAALQAMSGDQAFQVSLVHGITGSGKTEVYLRWMADRLSSHPDSQVLLLVPEIALTPQLAQRVLARLQQPLAILHSAMAEGERAANWLAAVEGRARIVIGTRLSILVPLKRLAGIVVDEEHDPSFKQQEAPHYSARDLAILRARQSDIPVVLGSATPSLETWHASNTDRYRYLQMAERASGAPLPQIEIHSLRGVGEKQSGDLPEGFCQASVDAIKQALARKDQVLVFLNRRGYAPVLSCSNCDWLSECDNCAAYRVLHRGAGKGYQLICHHCATESRVPQRCPGCGDLNLRPLGRGTQRIEEVLTDAFEGARVARLDRDVARRRGAANAVIDAIHAGEIDIIVGTQMLAKGHDFQRLNLVVVLDADGGLFASDYRAQERLYATLTQVAGRAGRNNPSTGARVLVQTRFTDHPMFESLIKHDFAGFAQQQLQERSQAGMPPFSYLALLRMEATSLDKAIEFGRSARQLGESLITQSESDASALLVYDPIPMPLSRLAGKARAQLLIESTSRPALHRFIAQWQAELKSVSGPTRWQIEIDPAEI
jgi:primosomal protein N' (replication factor Y)